MSHKVGALKSIYMDADDIDRALVRIAHQIVEANNGIENVALVGIVTRGYTLANRLVALIERIEGVRVPLGQLDISFYRDDFATYITPEVLTTNIPFNIDAMQIVLVDDVLYTGRTIRAALDALMDEGRPASVQLAVLIDRGHRELPIRADFLGRALTTSPDEDVRLFLDEVDGETSLKIFELSNCARTCSS